MNMPHLSRLGVALLVAACASSCAPERGAAYEQSLAAASRASHAGRYEEAAKHLDEASKQAKVARDGVHARFLAAMTRARAGDVARAATELRALAEADPPNDDTKQAAYELARLTLASDQARGEQALEAVVLRFPHHAVARLALGRLLRLDREAGGPSAVLARLDRLKVAVKPSDPTSPGVEETIAYERAKTLIALDRPTEARDALIEVARRWTYPYGGYFDDALFRASELDVKLGEPRRAIEHLEELLGHREGSFLVGSYERPRYSPALLRIADIYERDLHDRAKARETLERFYREFSRSVMRDDVLWREATLWLEDGDRDAACKKLDTLTSEFPDSRYVPCASMRCPNITRPRESKAPKECRAYIERGYRAGAPSEQETTAGGPSEAESGDTKTN